MGFRGEREPRKTLVEAAEEGERVGGTADGGVTEAVGRLGGSGGDENNKS